MTDIEVKPLQADFTERVPEIVDFIRKEPNSFPFFFIDPTGWSPLAIGKIRRLLQYHPSEVLINFMTSHIKRFLETSNFEMQFGPEYMKKVLGRTGQTLDDLAAYSFADEIRRFYPHTCTSVVVNPLRDQTHFHLIYGTRNMKGVEKFKEAEKSCFGIMQAARIEASSRESDSGQGTLWDDLAPDKDAYVQHLRRHHLQQAFAYLTEQTKRRGLNEEEAWSFALRFPLVWKSDLRNWKGTLIKAAGS